MKGTAVRSGEKRRAGPAMEETTSVCPAYVQSTEAVGSDLGTVDNVGQGNSTIEKQIETIQRRD